MYKAVTQCSQFYHEVQITGLKSGHTYYYQIPAANGTTESEVLSFTTAQEAGDKKSFTVAVINDMGYTNARGTHKQLVKAIEEGTAFAWHGGDLSYADDWYSGVLPCADDWPVCYNGTDSELPGPAPVPAAYKVPLPAGEVANQGGPQGGDMSVIYESNWDLWQQWMGVITSKIPYMVLPGNHEASCAEFDGPGNVLSAYLDDDEANTTIASDSLNYYSCPPSQRNFTAFTHRFRMPGDETGGVGNFWYSFDYGLAHFISFDGETDYPNSPEYPFSRDIKGNETHPTPEETYPTDSGPFGAVDGDQYDVTSYEQYKWLEQDLASIDRSVTPWVILMSHRPMYSSAFSKYMTYMRDAFEDLMLKYGVDVYIAGHIHWYERMLPLKPDGVIDTDSVIDANTYYANEGVSMTHLTNGAAGNIESHSTLSSSQSQENITQVLDFVHFGLAKLEIVSEDKLTFKYIYGDSGEVGDHVTILKKKGASTGTSTSSSAAMSSTGAASSVTSGAASTYPYGNGTATGSATASATGSVTVTTEVVTSYTTWCPYATTFTQGSNTYTVSSATTLTITDCPCTLTHTYTQT